MRPIGNKVLVKASKIKEESKVGEIVVDLETSSENDMVSRGTVIEVGKGVTEPISSGEEIYFETHGGHKVKINGEEMVIVALPNILAVI